MHGGVFPDEALAEAAFVLEEQVSVAVVVEHALRQVEQGAQLTERAAVRFNLPRVVRYPKEDAATVSCDVAPLVDDVKKAATHDLKIRIASKTKWRLFMETLWMENN